MKQFSKLYQHLHQTSGKQSKIEALVRYFIDAPDEDKLWAIALFFGKRPKRIITTSILKQWLYESSDLPPWLLEESHDMVGDVAETAALILPIGENLSSEPLSYWLPEIIECHNKDSITQKAFITGAWDRLTIPERLVFNKIVTGGFRITISDTYLAKAISTVLHKDEQVIMSRLVTNWDPAMVTFSELFLDNDPMDDFIKPYPFYLAYSLDKGPYDLGSEDDWYAERKWEGIRCQLVHRKNEVYIWSKSGELITHKFPEFNVLNDLEHSNYILDGLLSSFKGESFLPVGPLESRLSRKNVTKKQLLESPALLIAFDILEYKGEDLRSCPLYERRPLLESLLNDISGSETVLLSPLIPFNTWSDLDIVRERSREEHAKGLMIKRKDAEYLEGRKRGQWWKWNADPIITTAVLMYVERSRSRNSVFASFTFGVWGDDGELVSFAKTPVELSGLEVKQISDWIRKNMVERFGPVVVLNPELVFEIEFHGIAESKRHKSGIVLKSPKIRSWLQETPANKADKLKSLKSLL